MATPIVELIAQNIKTTLDGVTIANGYSNTLIVERRKQNGNEPIRDCLAILFQGDPTADENGPHQRIEWTMPFHVLLCAVLPDTSTTSIDARLNSLRADAEKALVASPNRGGYAIDTTIRDPQTATNKNGDVQAVLVTAEVKFRTMRSDPYSQG
jgi:hypothetical protein